MNKENLRKKKRNQGITLVALVITIIVLLILAGITLSMVLGPNGIIDRAKQAKEQTEGAALNEQEILNGVDSYINEQLSGTNSNSSSVKKDGSFDTAKGVNSPKITGTGLKPVYFNGEEKVYLTEASSKEEWDKWYSYSENNPVWANAESSDGSLWVWIPRYAYKITSNLGTGTKGNIDVVFVDIKNKNNGTTYLATYPTVTNNAMEDYVVHPAFINDSANGYVNGGWKEDIPGIWVAKYAAGFQNSTVGEDTKQVQYSNLPYTELNGYSSNFLETTLTKNTTKMSYPVFKSNTYAYNIISVGDAFLLAKEIGKASDMYGLSNVDSHLMKNSEWGAVAYLAQSKYGRNGNEITINSKNLNNSIYVNNASSGTKANVYAVTGYGNKDTANDVSASTTNNMSGIFDLNGCVWERVAGYFKGGAASTPTWHNSMASSSTSESSEYLTLYESYGDHYGDAVKETSGSSSSSASWNSDYSNFVSSGNPVFFRGGIFGSGSGAGSFAFSVSFGNPTDYNGFRAVLVP